MSCEARVEINSNFQSPITTAKIICDACRYKRGVVKNGEPDLVCDQLASTIENYLPQNCDGKNPKKH